MTLQAMNKMCIFMEFFFERNCEYSSMAGMYYDYCNADLPVDVSPTSALTCMVLLPETPSIATNTLS